MHSKDMLFLLLLIYITSDTQNTNVFSEDPKQGDTQITMTAPETD